MRALANKYKSPELASKSLSNGAVSKLTFEAKKDGENDLEMLYYVAHPFVMPNAPDFIKREFSGEQIALSDNNHDGVLKTIDKLIAK
ncbi:hypothetical protein ATW79_03985 [Oenococcus oeni]|nr:hypothetical protein ATW79_03985 [Oenococcus oeni]